MHSHFPHTHHYCTAKPLNCTFCPHATQPVEWMVTFWCHLETRKKYNTYNKDALHIHMIKILLLVYCNSDSSMSLTTRGYKAISYLEVNGEGEWKGKMGHCSNECLHFLAVYEDIFSYWWVMSDELGLQFDEFLYSHRLSYLQLIDGPCSRGDEEAHFWCTTKIEPRLPLECCWDTLGRTRNKPTNSNSSKAIWGFNLSADWELILQIKCRVFASGDF